MYEVKVFDEETSRWRSIKYIIEDYFGYCHCWDEDATKVDDLVEAFTVADLLWFHGDKKVRAGIFDATKDEVIYDSFSPVDLGGYPAFKARSGSSSKQRRYKSLVQRGVEPGT
jgi:hypothetical protein